MSNYDQTTLPYFSKTQSAYLQTSSLHSKLQAESRTGQQSSSQVPNDSNEKENQRYKLNVWNY